MGSNSLNVVKNCRLCQHFSKPAGIPNCWFLDWSRWPQTGTSRPDVMVWWKKNETRSGGIPSSADNCPGFMLAEEILVAQHREAHGLCCYCSYPQGHCRHTIGR